MRLREWPSRIWEVVKGLKELRIQVSHSSMLAFSALSVILFLAFIVRLLPLRWGLELSEFDPYFQHHFAEHLVENGIFSNWVDWIDYMRWYPYGHRSGRALPGLPLTAAVLYEMLAGLGVSITLYDFCVLFPAIFGTLTCLVLYFMGRDYGGPAVGLFSALFLALNSSHISRTSLGFFDDETVGVFGIILFCFLLLRSIEEERTSSSAVKYAMGAGAALGYVCASWGAALYPIGMMAIFFFALIIFRRYSQRLLLSYSITSGLGLFLAINVPKLSTSFLVKWAVLPIAGVFILLCLGELNRFVESAKWKLIYTLGLFSLLIGGFLALSFLGYMGGVSGRFFSVLSPFERVGLALVRSVAEHRVTAWGSLYYDFGVGVFFFVAGIFFAVRNLTHRNLFLVIFGLTSLYFASSMVRLTLILAPAVSLLAGLGLERILKPFVTIIKQAPRAIRRGGRELGFVGKEFSWVAIFLVFLLLIFTFAFTPGEWPPRVVSRAYTPVTVMSGSLPIKPGEPVTEWVDALEWIRTEESVQVVCSWWDYGYWIRMRGNKTSLADNATTNTTQIENVAYVFMSNEAEAVEMLERYDATHILLFITLSEQGRDVGYGDEGKWRWMARIAGQSGRFDFEDEMDFGKYNATQQAWMWNQRGAQTTFYKLLTYAKSQKVGRAAQQPEYFDMVYPWENGEVVQEINTYGQIIPLVAIYKVDYEAYHADHTG